MSRKAATKNRGNCGFPRLLDPIPTIGYENKWSAICGEGVSSTESERSLRLTPNTDDDLRKIGCWTIMHASFFGFHVRNKVRNKALKHETGFSPKDSGSMANYRFYIRDTDSKGQPIDDVVRKAAESIAPILTRYGQEEIGSERISDEMLQSAVEAASNAKRKTDVENPSGYLSRIYKRFVDKFLDREQKLVLVDDDFLKI
jgi:hypothetical protein